MQCDILPMLLAHWGALPRLVLEEPKDEVKSEFEDFEHHDDCNAQVEADGATQTGQEWVTLFWMRFAIVCKVFLNNFPSHLPCTFSPV